MTMDIEYTLILGIEKAELDALWPHMTGYARQTFADIQNKAKRYCNRPTEGQRNLIFRFMNEARMAAQSKPRAVIDLTRITAMFTTAAAQLKRPFVIFATYRPDPDRPGKQLVDQEFRISQAGANSTNPGCLYVKQGGTYCGKITPAGMFVPVRGAPEGLVAALEAFAADPARAALAYGQATSNCCFCATALSDPVSVDLGYGPICAKRWGLPHRHTGVHRVCEEVA